jgi:hypothetical protein
LLAAPVADAAGEGTGVPWVQGVQRIHWVKRVREVQEVHEIRQHRVESPGSRIPEAPRVKVGAAGSVAAEVNVRAAQRLNRSK